MGDRFDLFDHTIHVERRSAGWHAEIWRSSFNDDGIIDGVVRVAEVSSWSRILVRHRARQIVRHARMRGAQWPRPHRARR